MCLTDKGETGRKREGELFVFFSSFFSGSCSFPASFLCCGIFCARLRNDVALRQVALRLGGDVDIFFFVKNRFLFIRNFVPFALYLSIAFAKVVLFFFKFFLDKDSERPKKMLCFRRKDEEGPECYSVELPDTSQPVVLYQRG
jgi:hypothetical protein